jgi:hypothetical protein
MAYTIAMTPQQHCGQIADFLVANPGAWIRGSLARNEYGYALDPGHPQASQWCSMGLLDKFVTDLTMHKRCEKLLHRVIAPMESIVFFNDMKDRTINDVIQAFRCASYMIEESQLQKEREEEATVPIYASKFTCSTYDMATTKAHDSVGATYAKALAKSMAEVFAESFKESAACTQKVIAKAQAMAIWKPEPKDVTVPNWNVLAHAPPIFGPKLISNESWYIKQSVGLLKAAA